MGENQIVSEKKKTNISEPLPGMQKRIQTSTIINVIVEIAASKEVVVKIEHKINVLIDVAFT